MQKYLKILDVEKQTYSYDEAFEATLKYFKGDELAARVWVNKYAMKDSYGNIYEQTCIGVWPMRSHASKPSIPII